MRANVSLFDTMIAWLSLYEVLDVFSSRYPLLSHRNIFIAVYCNCSCNSVGNVKAGRNENCCSTFGAKYAMK
jgi:hypothetical protein